MTAIGTASEADTLVSEAHRRAYRFPPEFSGFTARLRWESDAGEGEGSVLVQLGGRPSVELSDVEPEWVARDLRSIVAHRAPRSYEQGDGAFEKRLLETGPLGVRVEISDSMDSYYVVGGGQIALITRTHEGERFTIAIQQRTAAGDGSEVPTAFSVSYWDEGGGLLRSEAYADSYVELAGVFVPASRTVVQASGEGITVRKLALFEHELLQVAAGDR